MDEDDILVIWYIDDGSSFIKLLGENVVVLQRRLAGGGTEPTQEAGKVGTTGEAFGEVGSGQDNSGEILCGGGASSASVWVKDVGNDPPSG